MTIKTTIKEPHTFKKIGESLDVSIDKYNEILNNEGIDAHTQIKDAKSFATRLKFFIEIKIKQKKIKILDCGSGLGFISRELIKFENFEITSSDPSPSAKKIYDKLYPDQKFIHSDIESLNDKFNDCFDVIYLREVYPFTRHNDLDVHKKLLNILMKKLTLNGILIFEQIKNNADLFDNLKKLNFKYEITQLLPIKYSDNNFLNELNFKYKIVQYLIKIIYSTFNKKVNHFIIINKKN